MESRRSSRANRKTIDYSKFSCENYEDDDFQSSASPPNKKKKQDKAANSKSETTDKEEKRTVKSSESKDTNISAKDQKSSKIPGHSKENSPDKAERLPISERVLQRDLQTALQHSKTDSGEEKENVEENATMENKNNAKKRKLKVVDENDDSYGSEMEESDSESCSDSDQSDWSEESASPKKKVNQKKAGKQNNGKPPSKAKASAASKTQKPARTTQIKKNTPKTTSAPKSQQTKLRTCLSNPDQSVSAVHALVKPANLPSLGIRLGLSRKAAVKPLHPTLKIQP